MLFNIPYVSEKNIMNNNYVFDYMNTNISIQHNIISIKRLLWLADKRLCDDRCLIGVSIHYILHIL